METIKAETSSSLATVEEIQRRLVRPSSHRSQSSISSSRARENTSCNSPQLDVNPPEFPSKREPIVRETTKKRLEDYLDPVLLSAIRAKVGGKRQRVGEMKVKELEFEWPDHELKVLTGEVRKEKGNKWLSDHEAVDLGDDVDVVRGFADEDDVSCTPFERFERTALRRFRG